MNDKRLKELKEYAQKHKTKQVAKKAKKIKKPKFKVGDRVKFIKIIGDDFLSEYIGKCGKIVNNINYSNKTIYGVEFDCDGARYDFYPDELELVKDEPVKDEPKLYETTFKHKYKVGDRVELKDGRIETIAKVGLGFYIFDNDRIAPHYFLESRFGIYENDIEGLAPKELLSREEKQLLRDEIKRCYDRWDECPEINEITLIRIEQDAYIAIYLISNIKEKYRCIGNFIVNSKYFKLLNSGEYYSLKKLGL